MVRVAIIGTGDLAHGLAHLFNVNNSESYGNYLEVTKPGIKGEVPFHATNVKVQDFDEVVNRANVLILAIPSSALEDFVSDYASQIENKILVDPTNSKVAGEDLSSILSSTSVRWVKAFNDIGAVDILLKKPQDKMKVHSKMCSPDPDALKTVQAFAEESLGFDVKIVPYEQYPAIALSQNSLGSEWMLATWIMIVTFIITQIYNIIRHPVAKGYPWYSFPLFCMNKAISWTSISGFALAQLPGIFALMSKSIHGDTLCDKPMWLRRYLAIRKHLGLISLWFLTVHIFMSCLMFGPNYYGRFFVDPNDALSRMTANGETSFMCGSFGAALYVILGICSLPSVADRMTNAQWKFVFGPVAWSALLFGTFHVICQGAGVTWDNKDKWPWGLPPITLMSTLLPMTTLALKIFQVLLCWALDCRYKKKHPQYSSCVHKSVPLPDDTKLEGSGSSDQSKELG